MRMRSAANKIFARAVRSTGSQAPNRNMRIRSAANKIFARAVRSPGSQAQNPLISTSQALPYGGTNRRMLESFVPRVMANLVLFSFGYVLFQKAQSARDLDHDDRERRADNRATEHEEREIREQERNSLLDMKREEREMRADERAVTGEQQEIRKINREKETFESLRKQDMECEERWKRTELRAVAHEERETRQVGRDKEQEKRAIERAECQRETQQLERSRQIRERAREMRELREEERAKREAFNTTLEPGWESKLDNEVRIQYQTQATALQQDLAKWEAGGDQYFKEELREMRDKADEKAQKETENEERDAMENVVQETGGH